ncbi:MAG: MBL fold metallo-hydrolase RNA specificity domain-containing protein [Methanomassiliicoccales archaeon]
MARLIVFDGADCIGGNKIHLSFEKKGKRTGVFLDFGINYHKLGDYYQEFLQPRSCRGVHDHVQMHLVPFIQNYRHDVIPDDLNLSKAPKLDLAAIMVSHAHMDHMGHAALLALEVPMVCSPITAAIMKAMRDLDQGGFESQCAYTNVGSSRSREGRVISYGSREAYHGRDIILTQDWAPSLTKLWSKSSAKNKVIEGGGLFNKDTLDLDFESFPVDHSIFGSTAYAINTEKGYVVYTGDLRSHGTQADSTWDFVRKAASLDPVVLIIEGTTTSRSHEEIVSEASVRETCLHDVQNEKGLIVADFSPRHFERLETFKAIAIASDRQLVVTFKDIYYLWALGCADGKNHLEGLVAYDALKTSLSNAENFARDLMIDSLVDPKEISADPGRYILAFSFYDMGNMLDIGPIGGTYIYSSSEIYNEEQVIDFLRLHQWLKKFGMNIKGFRIDVMDGRATPVFDHRYHASGHASVEDLLRIVEEIDPKLVIPVHTENPHPFSKWKNGRVLYPGPAEPIDL